MPLTVRDDASTGVVRVPEHRHDLAGLQPLGQLQPLLRPDGRRRAGLRQPGARRLLRSPLPADVGLGRGRLRRQRVPAALPPREARPRPHLLDRRRPARASAAPAEPPLPVQHGPRRVLVPAHAPRRRTANAAGVNLAFLGANACYRQIRLEPSPVGPTASRSATSTPPRIPWPGDTPSSPGQLGRRPRTQPESTPHR